MTTSESASAGFGMPPGGHPCYAAAAGGGSCGVGLQVGSNGTVSHGFCSSYAWGGSPDLVYPHDMTFPPQTCSALDGMDPLQGSAPNSWSLPRRGGSMWQPHQQQQQLQQQERMLLQHTTEQQAGWSADRGRPGCLLTGSYGSSISQSIW